MCLSQSANTKNLSKPHPNPSPKESDTLKKSLAKFYSFLSWFKLFLFSIIISLITNQTSL